MKIYITGFDARSARIRVGEARLSFGYLLARAFELRGHQVFGIDSPLPDGELADLALVGVGSPVSPSATYVYHALSIMPAYQEHGKLIMFLDDPDVSKIWRGFRSAANRADDDPLYARPNFRHRRGWTEDPAIRGAQHQRCALYADPANWPTTLVPVQARWADSQLARSKHIQGLNSVLIDPTNVAVEVIPPVHDIQPQQSRGTVWWIEPVRADKWAYRVITKGTKRALNGATSMDRLFALQHARGVLESPAMTNHVVGWWTPNATLATQAKTFYATDVHHTDASIADSNYNVMPQSFEYLPAHTQMRIAEGQSDELSSSAPSIRDFVERILDVRP